MDGLDCPIGHWGVHTCSHVKCGVRARSHQKFTELLFCQQRASLARVLVGFPGHFFQKAAPHNWLPALLTSLWDVTEELNP